MRARKAFSLIEVVVLLALAGLVGSTIGVTLVRQQRFYRGSTELLHAREDVRDALAVLATDVRGMSAADTARLLADSAFEFFAQIGTSVACGSRAPGRLLLPPELGPSGNTLSSFAVSPDTGDLALVYRNAPSATASWERHRIIAFIEVAAGESCASGFATGGARPSAVDLDVPLSADVQPGAPVRFIRRGRYSLYRSSDREWYLGYRRCDALGPPKCGTIQPLSGPYRPYSSDPRNTGLLFEYFAADGSRVGADPSRLSLARVDVTARAASSEKVLVEGRSTGFADSATLSIAVRNRR